jgi:hypothetical protein
VVASQDATATRTNSGPTSSSGVNRRHGDSQPLTQEIGEGDDAFAIPRGVPAHDGPALRGLICQAEHYLGNLPSEEGY